MDAPRLRDPLLSTILTGICAVLAWWAVSLPGWALVLLTFLSCVFAATALVTGIDYLVDRAAEWQRELGHARVWGAVTYAYALKGLTQAQTEMVDRESGISIYAIPGDGGPAEYVRCLAGDVPKEFVIDFFREAARLPDNYLPAVRDGNKIGGGDGWTAGVKYATLLTNTIVHFQWADNARGTNTAIATIPLEELAAKFGVEV